MPKRMIVSYEELKSSPGGLSLPLFTVLPRRRILGNSEGIRRAGAVRATVKALLRAPTRPRSYLLDTHKHYLGGCRHPRQERRVGDIMYPAIHLYWVKQDIVDIVAGARNAWNAIPSITGFLLHTPRALVFCS